MPDPLRYSVAPVPSPLSIPTRVDGALKNALNESGWLGEEVVAAGQLRQGKAPSTLAMVTGMALIELWRPRRTKLLPRHFVLALTRDRMVVFKATGGKGNGSPVYGVRIQPGEEASFPLEQVSITDLPKGDQSKGGTMHLNGEAFPVCRPNLNGDPNTDELIGVLAR